MLREKSTVHVLSALHQAALRGDVKAGELILKYSMPECRSSDEAEPVGVAGSLSERASGIIDLMTAGEITPEHATAMLAAIRTAVEVSEVAALQERLAELEAKLNGGGHAGLG